MSPIPVAVIENDQTWPGEAARYAARRSVIVLFVSAWTFLVLASGFAVAQQIPSGTVLPVMLNSSLDARHAQPGERVTGRIMQDVPLPEGARIRRGTRIVGHIVKAQPAHPSAPSQLSLKFDYLGLNGQRVPVSVTARAIASMNEVFEARMPTNAWDDYGTSPSDWNTVQIGGAGVYRGNGEVVMGNQVVGRATDYGAVTARLIAAPERGCPNASEREQALWKFSPWSCGAYGFNDLMIVRSPDASGVVDLQSSRSIRIDGGSGWLLKTVAPGSD